MEVDRKRGWSQCWSEHALPKETEMTPEFIERILTIAAEDREFEARLMERPAETLRECGFCVSTTYDEEFAHFFWGIVPDVFNTFRQNPPVSGFMSTAGAKCAACKVSAWTVGMVIVGLGAAGVAVLTASSPAIAGLAAFMGVAPAIALGFVSGLAGAVLSDIKALVAAICKKMGICP